MAEAKRKETKSEDKRDKSSATAQFSGLYRSETNKVIAGVAGGLGEYFNIDPTIIRILFVLMTVFGGSGIIIYLVLWLIMPSKSSLPKNSQEAIKDNLEDMKAQTQSFAHSISKPGSGSGDNSKFWWALLIIVLGFFFLLNNYDLLDINFGKLWPVILIIFGLFILVRRSK